MTRKPIVLSLDRDAALTLGAMMAIAQVILTSPAAPRFFNEHLDEGSLDLVRTSVGVLSTAGDDDPMSVDVMLDRVEGMRDLVCSVLSRAIAA